MVCWSLEKQFPVAGKVSSSPQHKKKTQEAQHHTKKHQWQTGSSGTYGS